MSRDPIPSDQPDRSGERIAKLLARAGIASRREVERMIAEGRIALNGETVATPATVLRSLAGITVDGQAVAAPAPARLFVYHKPPGLLVTERDPGGRPTIYDRLPAGLPRVVPVGRLDLATEGLLLLTTDGGLKRALELPANGVERTYRARAYGQVSQTQLEDLIEGVEVEGVRYGSIDANLERRTGANVWIELTLTEGKNREVRRVLEHLGLQVGRLIRTRYGPFLLGDLQPGAVGEVRQHDLVAFRQTIGGRKAAATLPERIAVDAMAVPGESAKAGTPASSDAYHPARDKTDRGETTSAAASRTPRPPSSVFAARPSRGPARPDRIIRTRDGDAKTAARTGDPSRKRDDNATRRSGSSATTEGPGSGRRVRAAGTAERAPSSGGERRSPSQAARPVRARGGERTQDAHPATKPRQDRSGHPPTGKGRRPPPAAPGDETPTDRPRFPRNDAGVSDRAGGGVRGRPASTRRGPPRGRR